MDQESRTAKSVKNVSFALVLQLITVLIQFVSRTALIKTLGIDAVSLNGLFTEVISMLSLTEMGIGTAIIFNLYKPLAEDDRKKISQLMGLFKKAYRVIALVTFTIGVILIPWIQYLVNDIGYDTSYIRLVYFLFVCQTSASYLFSYKTSLLNADQKKYIVSIITAVTKLIGMILQVILLITTKNYIAFLLVNIVVNVSINIVASRVVDKTYPYINTKDKLPVEERKQVFSNIKNLFIRTLSGKVTNSTDNILISALVSTKLVGYYTNYSLFLNNVMKQLAVQLIGGITGSLGNMMATEEPKRCDEVLRKLTYIFFLAASILTMGFFMCLSYVIDIWLGEEYILQLSIVFVCCYVSFLEFATRPLWEIMTVSGMFAKDKNISIAGTVANLIVSIILGHFIGINGIFLGTICTYLIQSMLKIRLLYKERFKISPKQFYLMWLKMLLLMLGMMVVGYFAYDYIYIENPFLGFVINGCLAVAIAVMVNILFFGRTAEFKYAKRLILSKLHISGREKNL